MGANDKNDDAWIADLLETIRGMGPVELTPEMLKEWGLSASAARSFLKSLEGTSDSEHPGGDSGQTTQ